MTETNQDCAVLVCQHTFPGNGGSRVEKLVKYLPENGIRPVVVAGRADENFKSKEDFRKRGLPEDLTVEYIRPKGPTFFYSRFQDRGPASNRYLLYKLLSFPERSIYVPDYMVRWTREGKRAAERLVAEQDIRCVFTSSPRESTHLIGLRLKEHLGIPWIADFRDLWTHKSLAYRPATPAHDWYIRRLERRIMHTADHIVANTEENRDVYLRDFDLDEDRVTTVPNGFDRSDVDLTSPYQFPDRKFRIGHMGSLTKTSYPWREFLEAFARLGDSVGRKNIEFVHCGNHTNDVTQFVEQRGLESIFSYHGALPHFDAMQLIAGTDVQLVLLYDNEDSYTLAPQKLYNYMILPGPVLSIAPENGAVARVTREMNCGDVVPPGRGGDKLYQNLLKYYEAWQADRLHNEVDESRLEKYSRASQAQRIADIMQSVV